jgi:hypothetical protein
MPPFLLCLLAFLRRDCLTVAFVANPFVAKPLSRFIKYPFPLPTSAGLSFYTKKIFHLDDVLQILSPSPVTQMAYCVTALGYATVLFVMRVFKEPQFWPIEPVSRSPHNANPFFHQNYSQNLTPGHQEKFRYTICFVI